MDISNFKMTEEKVRKLKPLFEKILTRQYGREIKFITLTVGDVTISDENQSNKQLKDKAAPNDDF
ncbi:hypothetical protein CN918_28550 [Priestia megaterium]|nr:hypothetical protein CN918_28550 [Priestia megaterium]